MCGQASLTALKQLVLYEFLELSESSIHFPNASGRFLSITDEFLGAYGVPAGAFGGCLFFPIFAGYDSFIKTIKLT